MKKTLILAAALTLPAAFAQPLAEWPHVHSAVAKDPKLEARVARIVAGMTLEQKIGQMTQGEIKTVTPDDEPFTAAFANVDIAGGAASDADICTART